MAPQPIWIKRNPTTKSRLTMAMYATTALSLYGLHESNIETLVPAGFLAMLVGSAAILMRLSNRSNRYYIQITADSLLVYRSLFLGPKTYDISGLKEVKQGVTLIPGTQSVALTLDNGRKIRLSSWWLSGDDAARIQKVLERRVRS